MPAQPRESATTDVRLTEAQLNNLMRMLDNPAIGDGGRLARFFDWVDVILGKSALLLIWILEMFGMIWIYSTNVRFERALQMLENARTPEAIQQATVMLEAVKTVAESTNGLVLGFCAGLPVFIGAIKAVRKIMKERSDTTDEPGA